MHSRRQGRQQPSKDLIAAAKDAGLVYSTDRAPGIRRVRAGKGFRYVDAEGKPVRERRQLERIRSLVIPPNWSDVWICAKPRGHLQVTARDARGRKQYLYHPEYRAHREKTKFGSLVAFAQALPRLRRRIARDLSRRGLPRERVLAAIVRLLDRACIRIGNPEYARDNDSYGITTLRDRHARISAGRLSLRFNGKSGQSVAVEVDDRRLAAVVKRCRDLPGYHLFQYVDEHGEAHDVDSSDVNRYLREISGQDITAKDFRTWHGTVVAATHLQELGPPSSKTEAKRNIGAAVKAVSQHLGNRAATSRKYYIHPAVIDSYSRGELDRRMSRQHSCRGQRVAEASVLSFLRRRPKQ